jgi:hypothetical protein
MGMQQRLGLAQLERRRVNALDRVVEQTALEQTRARTFQQKKLRRCFGARLVVPIRQWASACA